MLIRCSLLRDISQLVESIQRHQVLMTGRILTAYKQKHVFGTCLLFTFHVHSNSNCLNFQQVQIVISILRLGHFSSNGRNVSDVIPTQCIFSLYACKGQWRYGVFIFQRMVSSASRQHRQRTFPIILCHRIWVVQTESNDLILLLPDRNLDHTKLG